MRTRDKIRILKAMKIIIYSDGNYDWPWGLCKAHQLITSSFSIKNSSLWELGISRPKHYLYFSAYWYDINKEGHKKRIAKSIKHFANSKLNETRLHYMGYL
jgi:hypothetical protein